MYIVKHRKIFYALSVLLLGFSIFSIARYGLNLGIDFKGGSILEVRYAGMNSGAVNASSTGAITSSSTTSTNAVVASSTSTTTSPVAGTMMSADAIKSSLDKLDIGEYVVRQAGTDGFIIRTKALSEAERKQVVEVLGGEVKRFDSVGPILGEELQGKAMWSMVLVLLAIIIFITYAFRGVSKPISSWKYGVVAIVALFHDVIIPMGIFSYLGHVTGGYEIDALFVTALLVILGFSIHDTIVVFDRTRENLKTFGFGTSSNKKTFEEIVGLSVSQTIARSINTSLTTMLALLALYFYGPATTENFSLALILGIAVGTYSSIFIGSPLLVTWQKWQERKGK